MRAYAYLHRHAYIVIWAIIYSITKNRTERLNEVLKQKQQNP